MQQLFLAGNVGKDAELRRMQNGDPVLGFSLAIDNGKDKQGNKRETTWYDCALWGKRGESLERHITKGLKLALTGRPTVRVHDGKAYLGISIDNLTFQGGGSSENRSGSQGQQGGGYDSGAGGGYGDQVGAPQRDLNEEIPF